MLGIQQGAFFLILIFFRNYCLHNICSVVEQYAGRLAFIQDHLSPIHFGSGGYAGPAECFAVCQDSMPIHPGQYNRVIREKPVKHQFVRELFALPVVLVPAPAYNP